LTTLVTLVAAASSYSSTHEDQRAEAGAREEGRPWVGLRPTPMVAWPPWWLWSPPRRAIARPTKTSVLEPAPVKKAARGSGFARRPWWRDHFGDSGRRRVEL